MSIYVIRVFYTTLKNTLQASMIFNIKQDAFHIWVAMTGSQYMSVVLKVDKILAMQHKNCAKYICLGIMFTVMRCKFVCCTMLSQEI